MEYLALSEVAKMAKPGDKLRGQIPIYPTGLLESKKIVEEVTFWDCIGCLIDKPDVQNGADYYLQKQEDESYIEYGIIREIDYCIKVPKEFINHIVDKFFGKVAPSFKWSDKEIVNCFYEDSSNGEIKYVCCYNSGGDAYMEEFKTFEAAWAYLNTDMDVRDCYLLDERIIKHYGGKR